ncbi:MAG: nucleotide sugar dehydrogenase [Candidatus Anstonellales archaeon]
MNIAEKIKDDIKNNKCRVAVVGIGYVGLPLVVGFAKSGIATIAFDHNKKRIEELNNSFDRNLYYSKEDINKVKKNIEFTTDEKKLNEADIHIIAVPTPVDKHKVPDLKPVISAGETCGRNFKNCSIIILESTVYPGVTEDILVPIVEKESGKKYQKDFFAAYSPERVNPGDREHDIEKVVKVTSGSTKESAEAVDMLYKKVAKQTFLAKSIKVAEAAKVIENAQRDINIAFMNELTMLFDRMGISIWDVLDAAYTKWNFLKFKPGLVGGHCIPVDPYYLIYKANEVDFYPEIIGVGRKTSDNFVYFILDKIRENLEKRDVFLKKSNILFLGITFKEDVPDERSSLNKKLAKLMREKGANVHIVDPLVNLNEMKDGMTYDALVFAVPHKKLKDDIGKYAKAVKKEGFIFDIKGELRGQKLGIDILTI